MRTGAIEMPEPLVKLTWRTIPKWVWNKVQLLIWAVILAYVGMLMVAGVYYLVFEVNPAMTALWHDAVSNGGLRHNIRDVGEGVLGGLLAQQVIWNHYKRRSMIPGRLDALEMRLHIANLKDGKPLSFWQFLASPFLVLLYAIPGFFGGLLVVELVHHYGASLGGIGVYLQQPGQTALPQTASLWSKVEGLVTQNWSKKLVGYGAALFWGRRPAKGVFDDLQLWASEWLVRNGRAVHQILPPTFRARYNDVLRHGVSADRRHGVWWSVLLWLLAIVSLGLAGFGAYVLIFIAGS